MTLLKNLPNLNALDKRVIAAIGDGASVASFALLHDHYDYPFDSAVTTLTTALGLNPEDWWDRTAVYSSLRHIRLQLPDPHMNRPLTPEAA